MTASQSPVVTFTTAHLREARIVERKSFMGLILLILVILLLVGGLPRWGYSRNWGYGPSGGLGLVLLILLILVLLGFVPRGF
jgi:uncharacterized membrane protein YkgB